MYLLIFIVRLLSGLSFESEVVGVMDGDTIEIRTLSTNPLSKKRLGKNMRIRLLHIDCPEKGERYYMEAKKKCSEHCFRKKIKILHQNKYDKYGRLLAEIILPDGKVLNQEMIKLGLAVHFKKYSNSYLYSELEIKARIEKIGVWSL